MERDIIVRKVTQDVLMFVWYKQEVIDKKPWPKLSFVPDINAELMNNLCISVWIDSYCNEFIWAKYFTKHFKRMTDSPYLFANYVAFACYLYNKDVTNAHESFLGTLSLVIHFVLHCWQRERKEFLNTCVDLFCEFFEREIRAKFEDLGSWKSFNEFLVENHESLQECKMLINSNQPEFKLFKELENEYRRYKDPYVIGGVVLKDITEFRVENNEESVSLADSVVSKMLELCNQTLEEVIADFAKTDGQVEELYRQTVEKVSDGITNGTERSLMKKDQEDMDLKANEGEQPSLQKDQEDMDLKANEGEQPSLQKDQGEIDLKANEGEQPSLQKDQENIDLKAGEEQSALQKDQEDIDVKTNMVQSTSQGVQEEALGNKTKKISSKKNKDPRDPLDSQDLNTLKSQDVDPELQESDQIPELTKEERAKILLKEMMDDIEKLSQLFKLIV